MRTMRRMMLAALAWPMVLLALDAVPAAAQNPGRDRPSGERLRQMIDERFAALIKAELALTDEQAGQVQRILAASAVKRRQMEHEERGTQQALRSQLRPGVAAQTDSVVRLLDRLTGLRVAFAQAARDEVHELGTVLTPVQQAQFVLLRDRMMSRAQEVRMQRPPGSGGR